MSYFLDESKFNCDMIVKRILETDLIPSLEILKGNIQNVMRLLMESGVTNLKDLRIMLKSKAKLSKISTDLEIDEDYLVLLRREIGGWIAKVRGIDEFDWIDAKIRIILKTNGVENSENAYIKLSTKHLIEKSSKELNIPKEVLEEIYAISNLLRIRWLSPGFTRIIHELGYTPSKIKKANAQKLTNEIDQCNQVKKYYKGKVGQRDVNRVIFESQYI